MITSPKRRCLISRWSPGHGPIIEADMIDIKDGEVFRIIPLDDEDAKLCPPSWCRAVGHAYRAENGVATVISTELSAGERSALLGDFNDEA